MSQTACETDPGLRLMFAPIALNYEEAMLGLTRIDNESNVTDLDETSIHLTALWSALDWADCQMPLDDRLCPLTDEDVESLARFGSFQLLGNPPLLERITRVDAFHLPQDSPFLDFYDYSPNNWLTVWDLCPKGDPLKPGMHLVAIRVDRQQHAEQSDFFWNIGWVTQTEFNSLFMKDLFYD